MQKGVVAVSECAFGPVLPLFQASGDPAGHLLLWWL